MRTILYLLLLLPLLLPGQSTEGLIAHYPFESNLGDATGDAGNLGVAVGAIDYDCGVQGSSVSLMQGSDFVRVPGGGTNNVNRLFDDRSFTVDLSFKSTGGTGQQYLVSKRDSSCANEEQQFSITYAPDLRQVSTTFRQGNVITNLSYNITNDACWQQVTVVRDLSRVTLYVNGEQVADRSTAAVIDISNGGDLLLGGTTCPGAGEGGFQGLIDEVRIYDRALARNEIEQLYPFPDRILTGDQQLFLGESVAIDLKSNCGTAFRWSPMAGVETSDLPEPTITPTQAGRQTYAIEISDDFSGCIARDSITLTVIDPDSLDCSEVFLPKAFTPNGAGPEVNETFGISNPFAVGELLGLTIYDRNGGKVFSTTDPFTRWDGSFDGKPVNPGVMLWRMAYRCNEQEVVRTGSITVLR